MGMERWWPEVRVTEAEKRLMKIAGRSRKLFDLFASALARAVRRLFPVRVGGHVAADLVTAVLRLEPLAVLKG